MTLTEFLLARIAEDQARAAEWTYTENVGAGRVRTVTVPVGITSARTLADCEAKRAIIAIHREVGAASFMPGGECDWRVRYCGACEHLDDEGAILEDATYPCDTLKAMALPDADHPDFDPAWAV